jgi:tRNA A-37 threonylcarbamoyl transferase component Bud32/anti-sigma factor RsiW
MPRSAECIPEDSLIALAEGKLPPDERKAVESHLTGCVACYTSLEWIKQHLLRQLDANGEPVSEFLDNLELTDQREVATRTYNGESDDAHEDAEFSHTESPLGKQSEYQIVRVLGRGGYGIVLEAIDTVLQRRVAIKVLKRDLANRETSRRRFIREARAGAAINHPNVVTIHGVDEARDVPFLIMELIRGESLRDRIRREPRLDLIDVIRISAQVAQGLAAAHSQGIIHRDVKPGNIMLIDSLPRVKITDFGLARVAIEDIEFTSRSLAVGTPAYMSPEQVRGEEVDTRSDLFSLGCVIYAMITGHSAYFGQTALEVARKIDSFDPPSLDDVDKRVPEFLSEIVQKLLQKDRNRRYQSAAEVADVLNRHLAMLNQSPTDKLPLALRTPLLDAGPRKSQPMWLVVPLAVAALALGLGAAWWSGWLGEGGQFFGNGAGGQTVTAATGTPPVTSQPTVRKPEVVVAQTGKADAKSIVQALRMVTPGGTVTIRDAAEYAENLQIIDPKAHAGLQIVATGQAKIRCSAAEPVLTIRGVPRVEIRGLTIVAPQSEHAIEVSGACPGLKLEDIRVERVLNDDGSFQGNSALYVHGAGTADEPIVVHRLTLRETNVGIVIGNAAAQETVAAHILIESCRVDGYSNTDSTLLALLKRCEHVTVRDCIFATGSQGLSIVADGGAVPSHCELSQSTWHNVENWFIWTGLVPPATTLRIHDNLLVEAGSISATALALATSASAEPVFQNNRLFNPSGTSADLAPAATPIAGLLLCSLQPDHPDYLRPDFPRLKAAGDLTEPLPGRYPRELSEK